VTGDSRSDLLERPLAKIAALLIFIVIAFAVYWSIMNNAPVADDWGLMYKVAYIPGTELWRLFQAQSPLFVRPIPFFSVWVFYRAFGLELMPSHLLNVGMHAVNAFLLVWFLARMGISRRTGYLAALLFLVTPIGAESVGWTTGRFDVWAMFFILLTLGMYASFLREGKKWLYIAALVTTVAAWLSKEPSMVLVGLVPVLELVYLVLPVSSEEPWSNRWRTAIKPVGLRLLILFGLFAAYIAMRYAIMGRLGGATYVPLFGKPSLHATAGTVLALLAPLDRLQSSRTVTLLLDAYLGSLYTLSLVLVIFRWKRASSSARRAWLFLAIWFAAALVPIYSYFFMTGLSEYLTNSRMYYIPYASFIALMVLGLLEFGWKSRAWRLVVTLALVALVPIFIVGLNRNNRVWENAAIVSDRIAHETVSQLPDPPPDAKLYFQYVPRIEGAHILASALPESIRLSYGRRDLGAFYVDPDPAMLQFISDSSADAGNGYLFVFDWDSEHLTFVRGPISQP